MSWGVLLPMIVGASVVFQGTLNKSFIDNIGLPLAVLINGLVFFIPSVIYWLLNRNESFELSQLNWLQFIPGFFGFLIVWLTPMAINLIGPTVTFSFIIASQLILSLSVEYYMTKTPPTLMTMVGVVVLAVGAGIVLMAPKEF